MTTEIRPELSSNNPYWVDKHRYYELRHFCMQYYWWEKQLVKSEHELRASLIGPQIFSSSYPSDPTGNLAVYRARISSKIDIVNDALATVDESMHDYFKMAIIEGLTYDKMSAKEVLPISRSEYYKLYRKLFWILDKLRD